MAFTVSATVSLSLAQKSRLRAKERERRYLFVRVGIRTDLQNNTKFCIFVEGEPRSTVRSKPYLVKAGFYWCCKFETTTSQADVDCIRSDQIKRAKSWQTIPKWNVVATCRRKESSNIGCIVRAQMTLNCHEITNDSSLLTTVLCIGSSNTDNRGRRSFWGNHQSFCGKYWLMIWTIRIIFILPPIIIQVDFFTVILQRKYDQSSHLFCGTKTVLIHHIKLGITPLSKFCDKKNKVFP